MERLTQAALPLIAGVIAGMIILSFVFGFVSNSTAMEMAEDAATEAYVAALAPLCVANATADPDNLALVLEKSSFSRRGELSDNTREGEKRLTAIRREIESLSFRAARSKSDKVAEVYEKQIEKLANEELLLEEEINTKEVTREDFGTALNEVFGFLKSPYSYWVSDDLNDKRLVLRLVFAEQVAYSSENGFGTPELSLPLRVFELVGANESQDVEMWRIELQSELGRLHESTMHRAS